MTTKFAGRKRYLRLASQLYHKMSLFEKLMLLYILQVKLFNCCNLNVPHTVNFKRLFPFVFLLNQVAYQELQPT